ncbi:DUF6703 family protein [Actinomadura sp. 9N407]|uniref:DUF6703 family protein n=1 Tax=Actinomadura sp. 9N407 TaxID=3375154 RepID=UPI00379E8EED
MADSASSTAVIVSAKPAASWSGTRYRVIAITGPSWHRTCRAARGRTLGRVNRPDEPSGMRAAVERWSATPLVYLSRLPRWALLVAIFGLLVAGMAGSGWVGATGLLVLLVLLGWFAYLNWPALGVPGRLLRVVALAAIAAFALDHVV